MAKTLSAPVNVSVRLFPPLKRHGQLGVKHKEIKGIIDGRPWHFLPVPMCLNVYINAICTRTYTYMALKSLVLSRYISLRPSFSLFLGSGLGLGLRDTEHSIMMFPPH